MKKEIIDGLKTKFYFIEEIKNIITEHNLNPSFNNKFELRYLNKDFQKDILKDLSGNIIM